MRAIISFPRKVTPLITPLSRVLPRCQYDSDIRTIMLRHGDKGIFIEPEKITIFNAPDEVTVKRVLSWLREMLLTVGE